MLGGGNPVGGANPAGTGSSINYVGKHAYAYSGDVTVGSAGTVTAIAFNTQKIYIVGVFSPHLNGAFSEDFIFTVKINDERIVSVVVEDQDNEPYKGVRVIIPPYSKVEITIEPSGHTVDRSCCVLYTGEVHQ